MYLQYQLEEIARKLINVALGRVASEAIVGPFLKNHPWAESLLKDGTPDHKEFKKIINSRGEVVISRIPLTEEELAKPATTRQRPGIIFEIRGTQSTLSISCEAREGGHFMPTGYTFVDKD